MLGLGHGLPELCRVLKHADQDLQAVQVRVFRGDDLKNGLTRKRGGGGRQREAGWWKSQGPEAGLWNFSGLIVTTIRRICHGLEL